MGWRAVAKLQRICKHSGICGLCQVLRCWEPQNHYNRNERKPLLKRRLTGTTKTLLSLAIAKPRVFTFGAVSAAVVVQVVVSIIVIS